MRNSDDPKKPHISYQKNKKAVEKYADPKTLGEHLATHTQEYAKAAPAITEGLNTAVMRGQQFLMGKLPQPQNSLPLSHEHRPSNTAMARFSHYYETVSDPLSVLTHVKKGTLRNEHIETLATVYPRLYEEMKKKITEHMDPESAKGLPYAKKLAIAKFMGQPMDASMLPQSILANQAALSGPRLGPQANVQKSTLGGLKELKQGERAQTEADDLSDD